MVHGSSVHLQMVSSAQAFRAPAFGGCSPIARTPGKPFILHLLPPPPPPKQNKREYKNCGEIDSLDYKYI